MSMSFGKWLRERREGAGLTLRELADRAGCSYVYVSMLERGAVSPSGRRLTPRAEMVEALATALRVPANEARMAAGYAPVLKDSPLTQRAVALFEALPEDIQTMALDVLVLMVEKFAPESRAFENESPFPAEPDDGSDFVFGDIRIKTKSSKSGMPVKPPARKVAKQKKG